jgi:hypothetical protein
MLRDWGVCWLLAVFSVRDLSRQSMTLIGQMEDAGRQLTSLAAMSVALGRSTFVSASLLHDPKPLAHMSRMQRPPRQLLNKGPPPPAHTRSTDNGKTGRVSRVRCPGGRTPWALAPLTTVCVLPWATRSWVYRSSTTPMLLNPPIRSEICTLPSFSGIARTHMPDVTTLCRAALKTNVVVCGAANFGTDRAAGIDNWSGHVAAWR